jgi:hypothetical protein
MGHDNPPTPIWFIFQGELAKDHVEQLRNPAAKLETIEFHISSDAYRRSSLSSDVERQAKPTVPGTIFERTLSDSKECQGAVAVIAHTGKDASEQGNLWLEIGFWLARRDVHLLQICHFGEIPAISDINNLPFKRYDNLADLRAIVSQHALHVREFHYPRIAANSDRSFDKIHATFSSPDKTKGVPWLDRRSYFCHRDWSIEEECPFRKKALEFAAELLRMGRANHERNTFEDCLSRIAYACRNLYYADSGGNARRDIPARELGLRTVRREVHRLSTLVKQLLGGAGRNEAYADALFEPKQRFARFLKERLAVAKQLELEVEEIEHNLPIETLQKMADDLWEALQRLASGSRDFRLNGARGDKDYSTNLWVWGDYCASIAMFLQLVGRAYFDECSEVLTTHLGNSQAPHFFVALGEIIDALPHNQEKPRHMRIWRAPSLSSSPGESGNG